MNMRSFDNSVLVPNNFLVVTVGLSLNLLFFSEPCPDPGRPHQGNRIGDFFCILFVFFFYRYSTRTYRSTRVNITKFTTITLITSYKEKLHYITLQGLHNVCH